MKRQFSLLSCIWLFNTPISPHNRPSTNLDINMLQGKKLVCFDLDGTLIDSVGVWNQVDADLIQQLTGQTIQLGLIQRQRDIQLQLFKNTPDPYLMYCNYLKDTYKIEQHTADQIKQQRYAISQHFLEHIILLKPHAALFVQQLIQQGIQVAITTTTSLQNIYRYQKNINIYPKLHFENSFDLILTRENVKNIKPHPEVYLQAIEHFAVQPEECLIFEDSLIGVEAANAAGIEVVAVYDAYSEHEIEQIKNKADYFIHDFSSVLN